MCNTGKKHYLSAKDLYDEYQKSISAGRCTDMLLLYFRRIAKHILTTFQYNNKLDADSVIEYAVAEAWQKWDTFDAEKSKNIFSFYTTMIINDIRTHYKQINRGKSLNISIEALFAGNNK